MQDSEIEKTSSNFERDKGLEEHQKTGEEEALDPKFLLLSTTNSTASISNHLLLPSSSFSEKVHLFQHGNTTTSCSLELKNQSFASGSQIIFPQFTNPRKEAFSKT